MNIQCTEWAKNHCHIMLALIAQSLSAQLK